MFTIVASPSTSHVLPTSVNSILCILSVDTWFNKPLKSSSSPSISTQKCSMNLDMKIIYRNLKSVSLLAFIMWPWMVYVESITTPFWMQYIITKSPPIHVAMAFRDFRVHLLQLIYMNNRCP